LVGCGSSVQNEVTGKVTYKGQPVAGNLVFVGSDGKESIELINTQDGSYKFIAPATGEYKIAVKGLTTPGAGVGPGPGIQKGPGLEVLKSGVAPPAKYASPDNGLKINVTGGAQTHNIELQP
jgi:hypothetical protein